MISSKVVRRGQWSVWPSSTCRFSTSSSTSHERRGSTRPVPVRRQDHVHFLGSTVVRLPYFTMKRLAGTILRRRARRRGARDRSARRGRDRLPAHARVPAVAAGVHRSRCDSRSGRSCRLGIESREPAGDLDVVLTARTGDRGERKVLVAQPQVAARERAVAKLVMTIHRPRHFGSLPRPTAHIRSIATCDPASAWARAVPHRPLAGADVRPRRPRAPRPSPPPRRPRTPSVVTS